MFSEGLEYSDPEGAGDLIGRNVEPLREGGTVLEAFEGRLACLYPIELAVDAFEVSGRAAGKVKVRIGCGTSGVGVAAREALEGLRDRDLDGETACTGRVATGSRAGEDGRTEDEAANKDEAVLIGAGLAARPGCKRAGIAGTSIGGTGLGTRALGAFDFGLFIVPGVGARAIFLESLA